MKALHNLLLVIPLLAASGMALADHDHDRGHGHGHDHHGWQEHRGHGHDRRHVEYRYVERRHGYRHGRWERGHRYGGPIYVVRDYGHHRLRQPPRGYGWVRGGGNDYLLVALATGIILDIATR